jgi:hypothetical protein
MTLSYLERENPRKNDMCGSNTVFSQYAAVWIPICGQSKKEVLGSWLQWDYGHRSVGGYLFENTG